MSKPHVLRPEATAEGELTLLTAAEVDQVSGGLLAVSSSLSTAAVLAASATLVRPVLEGGCPACRSGLPLDMLRDQLVNPVVVNPVAM
jgi:hypothetical protein